MTLGGRPETEPEKSEKTLRCELNETKKRQEKREETKKGRESVKNEHMQECCERKKIKGRER